MTQLTERQQEVMTRIRAYAASYGPAGPPGGWLAPDAVFPARDNRDNAARRVMRELGRRGVLEQHPRFQAYRLRAE